MIALVAFIGGASPASAEPFGAGGKIRYAAKTDVAGPDPSADYFSVDEEEQIFFVAHGSGPRGPEASKHAAEAEHPVMRSVEPYENWFWCYVDEVAIMVADLDG